MKKYVVLVYAKERDASILVGVLANSIKIHDGSLLFYDDEKELLAIFGPGYWIRCSIADAIKPA